MWILFTAMAAAEQKSGSRPAELFAWFDRLGFGDIADAKYIRIRTGASSIINGTRHVSDTSDGFLVEDDGKHFRAVLADLSVGLFEKKGKNESEPEFCGYRELSIKDEAQRVLKEMRKPDYFKRWDDQQYYSYFDRLSRAAQIFVLARGCAAQGHRQIADELVKALARHPSVDGLNPSDPLADWLAHDLARAMDWRARIAFRDASKSWPDIRAIFQRIVDHCPEYETRRAAEFLVEIDYLLAEQQKRTQRPADLAGLSAAVKAEELVWRLSEEQDPDSDKHDYWPRPWPTEPRSSNGAMNGLREMGFDAVPALLAELGRKERLTRSAARSTRYGGGLMTSNTHELAIAILNDIAGLNFYWMVSSQSPDLRLKAKQEAEVWWRDVQAKGERAWLNELVRLGGRRGLNGADRLLARFPDDFVQAAMEGIMASKDDPDTYPHRELLTRLAKSSDPRVDAFLLEQLKFSGSLNDRVAIANTLRERGRAEGEGIIRGDWNALAAATYNGNPPLSPSPVVGGLMDSYSAVIEFLANSNSEESLKELGMSWPKLPFLSRVGLIDLLRRRNLNDGETPGAKPSPAATAQIEKLFLRALEDTRVHEGASYGYDGGSVVDPRLCDLAADGLHVHWPHRYKFDRFAPESQRERQRLIMLNLYRNQSGLDPFSLPMERPKLPKPKWNHVAAVEWSPESIKPSPQMAKSLKLAIDKPFNADLFVRLLSAYSRSPQPKTGMLQLIATRDGDGRGIIIRVHLPPLLKPASNRNAREMVTLDRDVLRNGSGVGSSDSRTKEKDWDDFQFAAEKAIKSPTEMPFVIKASVSVSDEGTLPL